MFGNFKIPKDKYMKGYKIKLYPTNDQKEFIDKCINVSRFVYNWAIDREGEFYTDYLNDESLFPIEGAITLNKELTQMRQTNEFLKEIPHTSCRSAVFRAVNAWKKYLYSNCKMPRYKTKKNLDGYSYTTRAERMFIDHDKLRIEGLAKDDMIDIGFDFGISRAENPKFYRPSISKDKLGDYYITFNIMVDKETEYFKNNNIPQLDRAIGIDINNTKRFVLSTNEIIDNAPLKKELARVEYYRNKHQKDIRYRRNWEKTNPGKDFNYSNRANKRARKVLKAFKKLVNKRRTYTHTIAKQIILRNPKAIVMESISAEKLLQANHFVAKSIFHAAFAETVEIFEKKCEKYNVPFIKAPNDFKSTQTCSKCGNIQDMPLGKKKFRCNCCGSVFDRDINAALNLEALAY